MADQTFIGDGLSDSVRNILLNDFNSLFAVFRDPTSTPTSVVSAVAEVVSERFDPSDPGKAEHGASGLMYFVTGGTYGFTLNPDDLAPGHYHCRFSGNLTTSIASAGFANVVLPQLLVVEGQFNVNEATEEMDAVLRIRRKLKDLNTRLYRLDLTVQKWPDDEILDAIALAVDEINATPPMRTEYLFTTLPFGVLGYVIQMAWADLLLSQAAFENTNTYNMGDGAANLTLNRAGLYQSLGQAERTRVDQKVAKWKRSLVPHMHGQGTNQYPSQIRHVIWFVPNFKNIFGS